MKKINVNSLKSIHDEDTSLAPESIPDRLVHCFVEETMLTTNNGQKMIKDIDLRYDRVLNPVNEEWMRVARKKVSAHKDNVITITTNRGSVTVTENHPFMLLNGDLVKASDLSRSDILADRREGDIIKNIKIHKVEGYIIVCNLVFENEGILMNFDDVENHFVEANGVVAGVLYLQDKIMRHVPKSKSQYV